MRQIFKEWICLVRIISIFFTTCHAISQDIKTWHPSTNFLNPRNWEEGKIPCENDRVIFSPFSPVITMLPESLSVNEMILPLNGEVIFPDNAVIELTGGTREGACSGKDAHFKTNVDYWYDPVNWNITSDRAFPRIPNRRNLAVPHTLRVPCGTDTAQFPENTTFQTQVIYPMTKVAFLQINGAHYTQSEFEELLKTHVGSLLFPGNPRFRITNSPCSDETGCMCGNDGPEVKPTICNEVTPYCPELECSDPITPVGNCCPICGARIVMKHKRQFTMDTLMGLHSSVFHDVKYKGVESYTGKTFEGDIQSVFVDVSEYRGVANKVADKIYNTLNADVSGLYGIRSIVLEKSESWNIGVSTYGQSSGGMSSGGVAALVIALIITLGLGAAFFIYKKKHIPGFTFARFDLRAEKFELELGTTPHDELQPGDPHVASGSTSGPTSGEERSKGFDNPAYGAVVEEVPSAAEEIAVTKDFVENPMFMIFEDSCKHDSEEEEEEPK